MQIDSRSYWSKIYFCFSLLIVITGCAAQSQLITATSKGDFQDVQKMVQAGANINEPDSNGKTPLMHAILARKIDTAKYLIKSGAGLKAKDRHGYDALTYAVYNREIDLMKTLIDNGADVNARDINGNIPLYPPLYYAIEGRFPEGIKLLANRGANVYAKANIDNQETLLDYALFHGQMDVAASLGDKLWKPDPSKARIFFVGEGLYDYTSVRIGDRQRDLGPASGFAFIDVAAGNYAVAICEIHIKEAKPTLSIDTVAGQIYYFMISQEMKRRVVHYFGYKLDSFIFTPLKEAEAREKIMALLKSEVP